MRRSFGARLSSEEDMGDGKMGSGSGRPEGSAPHDQVQQTLTGSASLRAAWILAEGEGGAQKNQSGPWGETTETTSCGIRAEEPRAARSLGEATAKLLVVGTGSGRQRTRGTCLQVRPATGNYLVVWWIRITEEPERP
jgi:hypothetical protein